MKKWLCFLFIALSVWSCKKKEQTLGKDAIGSSNYLNGTTADTFFLQTSVVLEDSIVTDNAPNVVLGSYNDPKFGSFNASFYTQIRLAGINPNFGDVSQIIVDSMVLALEYVGYYGNLNPQTFEVYELLEAIDVDSTYYDFTVKTIGATNLIPVGKGTITPDPINKTIVDGDSLQSQLRLNLDTNLAKQFIAEATSGSTFASNDAFQTYFKGLCIRTNNTSQPSGQGAILYFNLNDPGTKLTIYYRLGTSKKTYDLLMSSTCADFSHVNINRSGKPVEQAILNPSSAQQEFYAQAFGVRAKVLIPGLNQFKKNQLIHRADLHLPIQFQLGSVYKPGQSISVATKKTALDQGYINTGVVGVFDQSKKEFKADIKTYLQRVINGDLENTGLILSPRFFVNSSERIIFNGPQTINKAKPYLVITYTTF